MSEDDEPLGDLRRDVEERRDDDGEDATSAETSDPDRDDEPLGDLRRGIEEREAEQSAAEAEEAFTEMDVEEVDSEDPWADLLLEEEGATEGSFPASEADGEFQVVDKRLCHRCRFFGEPPRLHCTHEGTVIHATVDMDHYRVSDCPMVNTEADPFGED
ncbi:MAG: hypothetical protein ABEJ59_05700 [Halanaeroarchaeum sp.]